MLVPLSMCSQGVQVRIKTINGGIKVNNRLNSLGLHQNTELTIVENSGALTVRFKNSKIAIGMGIAHKILCEEL